MSRKLIIIIIIIIFFIIGISILGILYFSAPDFGPNWNVPVFKTQEQCEKTTSKICTFGMCDYKCPGDDYWKGWVPTGKEINRAVCNYNNQNKKYFFKNIDECTRADFGCEEEQEHFTDNCGCGCEIKKDKTDINIESYLACGCGCCGGEVISDTKCLYRSKGDDLDKIIEEDKKLSQSSDCRFKGCSRGFLYKYCD